MKEPEMIEIAVAAEVTINDTPNNLYRTWADLRNLPKIFDFLESVVQMEDERYRCTAVIDSQNERISWNLEITEKKTDNFLRWHSYDNPDILFDGVVHFVPKSINKTEIRTNFHFFFPPLHDNKPYMMGPDFKERIHDNLRRFKSAWEAESFHDFPKNKQELPDGLSFSQSNIRKFETERRKGDFRKNPPSASPPL